MEQNQGSQEMGMKNFREEMAEVLDRYFSSFDLHFLCFITIKQLKFDLAVEVDFWKANSKVD